MISLSYSESAKAIMFSSKLWALCLYLKPLLGILQLLDLLFEKLSQEFAEFIERDLSGLVLIENTGK